MSLEKILAWDQSLFLAVNGRRIEWLDVFMTLVSNKFAFIVYLPVLYFLFLKAGLKKLGITLLAVLVSFAVTDLFAARFCKPFFARLRPCHEPILQGKVIAINGCGGEFGFFSNHAANHFGLAIFLGLVFSSYYPKTFKWFLIFPTLICYSRVYLGVHYPLDVFFGGLFGAAMAISIHSMLKNRI